jgi:hypothetical protein
VQVIELDPEMIPYISDPNILPDELTLDTEIALEPTIGPSREVPDIAEAVIVVAAMVFEPTIGPTTDVVPAMFVLEIVAGRSPF